LQQYRQAGFALSEAPPTIQDAIHICQQLDINYLWIDRVCIVQNNTTDKEKELAKMCDIYQNSWLTIVADSASGAEHGFLQDRNRLETDDCVISWASDTGEHAAVRIHPLVRTNEEDINWAPVAERGWALQERHLAARVVHFAARQIVWECPWTKASESFPNHCFSSIPQIGNIPRLIDQVALEISDDRRLGVDGYFRWMMLVTECSQRKLTNPRDKLPAISGLATMAAKTSTFTGDEYLAGLWRGDLIRQMLWKSHDLLLTSALDGVGYRAPSWSWAAVDGEIRFLVMDKTCANPAAAPQIPEARISLIGKNRFGQVTAGHIRLRGLLRFILSGKGRFVRIDGPAFFRDFRDHTRKATYHVVNEEGQDHGELVLDTMVIPPDRAFLFHMGVFNGDGNKIYALVLYPEGDIGNLCFKRTGIAVLKMEAQEWMMDGGDIDDIRII
jgi:hypothetical protein